MKHYQVKITDKAFSDMEAVYDYIAVELQAPDTAMKQYDRIADAIESLDTFPERCKLFDPEPEHGLGMPELTGLVWERDVQEAHNFLLRFIHPLGNEFTERLRLTPVLILPDGVVVF